MNELPIDIKLTYIVAITLVFFFVLFIIFVVVLYNRKQILFLKEKQLAEAEHQNQLLQKELDRQKSVHNERERISHDMHDDLGAGISALKLQAEFLKKKLSDESLQEDVDDLLKTSEDLNLSMREMLWSLNKNNDTIFNFVDYTAIYAENFFRKTSIAISIKKNMNENFEISSEMRRNLFLCMKEVFNNIYKHSHAKKVHLIFEQQENLFKIQIEDNGIGITENIEHGNGLRNIQKRMQEIHATYSITNNKPGTGITIEWANPN